ncbi:MAG: hypothetical protein ACFB10_04495 [Salibacteraceae bacterium]
MISVRLSILLFFSVFLFGCGGTPSVPEQLLGANQGLMRGFSMGDSQEKISAQESLPLSAHQPAYSHYYLPLGRNDSAAVTYSFNQDGLYNVIASIYLSDTSRCQPIFKEFVARFQGKYGAPQSADQLAYSWLTPNQETVKLVKETSLLGIGTIALYLGNDFFMADHILGASGGEFRGMSMGMTADQVKARESGTPMDEDEDYLYYDYRLNLTDSYTLTYSFDRKGLYEIQVDAYFEDSKEDASVLSALLLNHLSQLHGQPEEQPDGQNTWTLKSPHSDEMELSLKNESGLFPVGKVSVAVYDWVN